VPNIHAKTMIRRDKKGKQEYHKKFYNIGIIDPPTRASSMRNSASVFSINNMAKGLQTQASKMRIANLRKNYNNLIGVGEPKLEEGEDPVSNPFKDAQ
jgi:hypothetical protein